MNYYILLLKQGGQWFDEFGSYDKSEVNEEREEYHGHPLNDGTLVIITDGSIESLQTQLRELNK